MCNAIYCIRGERLLISDEVFGEPSGCRRELTPADPDNIFPDLFRVSGIPNAGRLRHDLLRMRSGEKCSKYYVKKPS